jgi:hypothetical protein
MDYMPIARIILRYGVGAAVGAAQGNMLAGDPDVVTMVALGIGALVEVGYAIAKRQGGAT